MVHFFERLRAGGRPSAPRRVNNSLTVKSASHAGPRGRSPDQLPEGLRMAAKRRASSEREGRGDQSNTGLIVALVFFVLTTIFLGVMTYYGYSGRSDAQSAEAKAKSDLGTMTKSRDEEKTRKLVLRVATGNDQKDDQTALAGLKGQFADAFAQETATLKNLPKWDPNLNRPTKTYQDMLTDALTAKLSAEKALKDAETNFAAAQQQFEEYKK